MTRTLLFAGKFWPHILPVRLRRWVDVGHSRVATAGCDKVRLEDPRRQLWWTASAFALCSRSAAVKSALWPVRRIWSTSNVDPVAVLRRQRRKRHGNWASLTANWRQGRAQLAVDLLPAVHKDPFDRMLVTQAQFEGMILLTSDSVVARYRGGPIELI